MGWSGLAFLSEPWFVIPWYAVGLVGLAFVVWDMNHWNTPLKTAIKWGWPIIVLFFSVVGLALYFATARAPHVGKLESDEEKKKAHDAYEENTLRRVNGAVIHCVAGDGLGIMSAMVIARATNLTFWEEFWFEYIVGFAFGWFIFQRKSMTMMTDSEPKALAMAFRAEFFSMLTVMGGMGFIMTFVTPSAVGMQPKPLTYAFWGFGMLGLMAGYVLTFPMNYMMIKMGWKHGMGSKEGSRPLKRKGAKLAVFALMSVLGAAALTLVAWAAELREGVPIAGAPDIALASGDKAEAVQAGLVEDILVSSQRLHERRRSEATNALDSARRAAQVGADALPNGGFRQVLHDVEDTDWGARSSCCRRSRPSRSRSLSAEIGWTASAGRGGPSATLRRGYARKDAKTRLRIVDRIVEDVGAVGKLERARQAPCHRR